MRSISFNGLECERDVYFLLISFRQEDLFRVLKVHAQVSPDEYCQAHAPIAAVLLMQMPAEPAFWCLKAICDKYVPGYYARGLVSYLFITC